MSRTSVSFEDQTPPPFIFAKMPVEVLAHKRLSHGAKLTYAALASFALRSNRVWPGQTRIAELLSVSDRQVRTYLDELRLAELVQVRRRGNHRTNVYTLAIFPEEGAYAVSDRKRSSAPDRKRSSAPDRKRSSGQTLPDRKLSSGKETREANAKKRPEEKEEDLSDGELRKVLNEAKRAERRRVYDKLDAFLEATGIDRAHLGPEEARMVEAFRLSAITPEDVRSLVALLKQDAWFQVPGRLTVAAVIRRWPHWVAAGRPAFQPEVRNGGQGRYDGGAENDRRYRELCQQIADERGEVYEGVAPSWWVETEGSVR